MFMSNYLCPDCGDSINYPQKKCRHCWVKLVWDWRWNDQKKEIMWEKLNNERPVVILNRTTPGCGCGCSWCGLFGIALVFLLIATTKVMAYLMK